jgi:hypothetical protein
MERWVNHKSRRLPDSFGTSATAINDLGQVVGHRESNAQVFSAVERSDGRIIQLASLPDSTQSYALGSITMADRGV